MQKEDIDKTVAAIEDLTEVFKDVQEAKKSGDKITLAEGGMLMIKHSGKAIKFIASIPEIGNELVDLDGDETSEIAAILIDKYGGSGEAKEAILDITNGAGSINQGVQKLIELKKTKAGSGDAVEAEEDMD